MCQLISERRVKARKEHLCFDCCEPIAVGAVHRVAVFKDGRLFYETREHIGCYEMMMEITEGSYFQGALFEHLCGYDDAAIRAFVTDESEAVRLIALRVQCCDEPFEGVPT